MSFIKKIKQFLGIGTVSVKLSVPPSFKVTDAYISGTVNITGKSDQRIKEISFELEEAYSTGSGDNKETKHFTLGTLTLNKAFDIKEGEVVNKSFELPFQLLKSTNDKMKEQGGLIGGLGKMGSFMDAEKSEYRVKVVVDVDGAKIDPSDSASIKKVA